MLRILLLPLRLTNAVLRDAYYAIRLHRALVEADREFQARGREASVTIYPIEGKAE